MSNKTIDQLPLGTTLLGAEELPFWQAGATVKLPVTSMLPSIAGASPAPAAAVATSATTAMATGVIWNYFNSPYAGIASSNATATLTMAANSKILGGTWSNSANQAILVQGSGTSVLFATVSSFGAIAYNAPVNNSMVVGCLISANNNYGILTNLTSGALIDSAIFALNMITNIVGGDAIELNSPGVIQSNMVVLGNILQAAEFTVGIANVHNVAVVGNVSKAVTGQSGSYGAFHIEDAQHSIAIVGNVGDKSVGYGISVQQDTVSPHVAEGVVSVGNNLKAATAQLTGSVTGSVLTVTALTNFLNYNVWIAANAFLQGAGIAALTYTITSQLTSSEAGGLLGGKGTYQLSGSPGNTGSQTFYTINNSAGFLAVNNGNGSLTSCVVSGNRFHGFGVGLNAGSQDIIATGNMLEGQVGTLNSAVYIQAAGGNVWGANMARNYPTLLAGTNSILAMCGKIVTTSVPTVLIGGSCFATLKGFAISNMSPVIVNGAGNSIPLFPTPVSGWGRLTLIMTSFGGGTGLLKYSATVYFNNSVMTVAADIVSALTNWSGVSLSTSGGNVVLLGTYAITGTTGFAILDFEGWISN